jgi:hypothetical protein
MYYLFLISLIIRNVQRNIVKIIPVPNINRVRKISLSLVPLQNDINIQRTITKYTVQIKALAIVLVKLFSMIFIAVSPFL